MTLKLVCLCLILLQIHSQFNGPIISDVPSLSLNIQISDDGSTLIISFHLQNLVQIYKNTRSGFELFQTINTNEYVFNVGVSEDGQRIGYEAKNLFIYEEGNNGYEQVQEIQFQTKVYVLQMKRDFMFVGNLNGFLYIYQKNEGMYELIQSIDNSYAVDEVATNDDFSVVALGGASKYVNIYMKNTTFQLVQTIQFQFQVSDLEMSEEELIMVGRNSQIYVYKRRENIFQFQYSIQTEANRIYKMSISDDFTTLIIGVDSIMKVYSKNNESIFQLQFEYDSAQTISIVQMNKEKQYFLFLTYIDQLFIFYKCEEECIDCYFPNNCSQCSSQYELKNATCSEIIPQKNNKVQQNQANLTECRSLEVRNEQGQCQIESQSLAVFMKARPIINILRKGCVKMLFLGVDDFWLYEYHIKQYDGIMKVIFETISFIEEKQWEMVGVKDLISGLKDSIKQLTKYDSYGNQKYFMKSGNNNIFIDNTFDYFVFHIPSTLLLSFLFSRLFYALKNYQVKALFSTYSYSYVIIQLLIQNNIQYFTFLGVRAIQASFSFTIISKWINIASVLFLFVIFVCAVSSYLLCFSYYRKQASEFLVNLHNYPSSYTLMIIIYGLRPFLRGIVHGILYQYWCIQLWMLSIIQFLLIITIVIFQVFKNNFESKALFVLQLLHYICLIVCNVLLLCKYEYFGQEKQEMLEFSLQILVYLMLSFLVIKFLLQLKQMFLCQCLKRKICQKNNSVVPLEAINHGENHENQQQIKIRVENGIKYFSLDVGNQVIVLEVPIQDEAEDENWISDYYLKKSEGNVETNKQGNLMNRINGKKLKKKKSKSSHSIESSVSLYS